MEFRNEPLAKHVSIRIGGPAERLVVPESEQELIQEFKEAKSSGKPFCVVGKGSNVIFEDTGFRGTVIENTKACKELLLLKTSGFFKKKYEIYAGLSISNQRFIRFCLEYNLEAPAYLFSVPGNMGGAIYMNAGTGIDEGNAIANALVSVKIFDGQEIRFLNKSECDFSFRSSIFHQKDWLILGAIFRLKKTNRNKILKIIRKRMDFVRQTQEASLPSAGSIFKTGFIDFPEIRGYRIGNAKFSEKSANWIVNLGGASLNDILSLIDYAKRVHRKHHFPEPLEEIEIKHT